MYIKKLLIIFMIISLSIPTICFADDFLEETYLDTFIEVSADTKDQAKEPITNSKNIIAIDRKSLSVLYEKNAYKEVPMASTTKIMTAIIVLENCDLTETVEISKNAANIRGSTLGITSGAKVSMNDLLYGLMLRSRKRLCYCNCRTCSRLCGKLCRDYESKSPGIKSNAYTFFNTTRIR